MESSETNPKKPRRKRSREQMDRDNLSAKRRKAENPEKFRKQRLEARLRNLERVKKQQREWVLRNHQIVLEKQRARKRHQRKHDTKYKLQHYLRNRLYRYFKIAGIADRQSKAEFGCSPLELKQHLESKFKEGMTWENYGKWHVDHIRPVSSFDFNLPESITQCQHYTNLQPLWAHENIAKGNR